MIIITTLLLTNTFSADAFQRNIWENKKIKVDKTILVDDTRNRNIPIAIYTPANSSGRKNHVVILNHGYGQNKGNSYLEYSYIANALASKGYYVVSIQHELPTDSLIPATGIPQVVRRPFWERGADNIYIVMQWLTTKQIKKSVEISLIGHSNGGDIVAYFYEKYPYKVSHIITLDNRRFPLPRTTVPKISSLRSCDMKADPGVLPTPQEQKENRINMVNLKDIKHDQMDDTGKIWQKEIIIHYLLRYLSQNNL